MSTDAIRYVLGLDIKSTPQKLLLMIIAHHMPDDGDACLMPQAQVAREMNVCVQQVRAHTRCLELANMLRSGPYYAADGRRLGTRYVIIRKDKEQL